MSYTLDSRSVDDLRRELRRAATSAGFCGDASGRSTWADLLFDGDDWRDAAEPSQALMASILEQLDLLGDHVNELPQQALRWLLESRLGIEPLPVVADVVPVVVTADPAALPAVVPIGTKLKAGKTPAGTERLYTTDDVLSVLGAEITGVWSRRTDPTDDHVAEWVDREQPLMAFTATAMQRARHEMVIVTDVITFVGGEMSVDVTFSGASEAALVGLNWSYSDADEPTGERQVVGPTVTGSTVHLVLSVACSAVDLDGEQLSYLRASFPDESFDPNWFDLEFTTASVAVAKRDDVVPDGAFFNGGVVDITKEFEPFGPIPKRGDSFFLWSEEAFTKPLSDLTVTIEPLPDTDVALDYLSQAIETGPFGITNDQYLLFYTAFTWVDPDAAQILWERYEDGRWVNFDDTVNTFTSIVNNSLGPTGSGRHSDPVELAGQPRHMVRAFLSQGDFGWRAYQRSLAQFAADAAASDPNPDPEDLVPPVAPKVARISISYQTLPTTVTDVRLYNGLTSTSKGTSSSAAFNVPAHDPSFGAITIRTDMGAGVLGSALSLYVDVDPAAACDASPDAPDTAWEVLADGSWRQVDVVDGTLGLRQRGVVRFVTPLDWDVGGAEVSADSGYWMRFRTDRPDEIGAVFTIAADAVNASYHSLAANPEEDTTPATPIPPGTIKGTKLPIAGVKKMTNPIASFGGRGLESGYLDRAPGVLRHRRRAVQPADYESLVRSRFPEVAVVRCLPHHDQVTDIAPGSVSLVVVPSGSEPTPLPSVRLTEQITDELADMTPVHADIVVLCPIYVTVSIDAEIQLLGGYAAAETSDTLRARIDEYLHPLAGGTVRFGRPFFPTGLLAFIEQQPEVDYVADFSLQAPHSGVERIVVDPCRGLIASGVDHVLRLVERL